MLTALASAPRNVEFRWPVCWLKCSAALAARGAHKQHLCQSRRSRTEPSSNRSRGLVWQKFHRPGQALTTTLAFELQLTADASHQ